MLNLYLILPESNPQNQWMNSNDVYQDEKRIITFVGELRNKIESIRIENYEGNYDNINIQNFLRDFQEVADYYPNPAFRLLRSILSDWRNWRDQRIPGEKKEYFIHQQIISDHTFCECAERVMIFENQKFSILNHYGHRLGKQIPISIKDKNVILSSISTLREISLWFAKERIPSRNFQVIEKHGENRSEERWINGELISPLKCSGTEAQELLDLAVGDSIKELYNFDEKYDNYIVFKYEGENPQNMYHGYHLPIETLEIPDHLKKELKTRFTHH